MKAPMNSIGSKRFSNSAKTKVSDEVDSQKMDKRPPNSKSPNNDGCFQFPNCHDDEASSQQSTNLDELIEAARDSDPCVPIEKSLRGMLQTFSTDPLTPTLPDVSSDDLTNGIEVSWQESCDAVKEETINDVMSEFDIVTSTRECSCYTNNSNQELPDMFHVVVRDIDKFEGHSEICSSGAWNTNEIDSNQLCDSAETRPIDKKERNRHHAKRSRERRKTFVEDLRQKTCELESQNGKLIIDIDKLNFQISVLSKWKQQYMGYSLSPRNLYKKIGELNKSSMKDDVLNRIIRHVGESDTCFEKSLSPWDVRSSPRDTVNESSRKRIRTEFRSKNPERRVHFDLGGSSRTISVLKFSKGKNRWSK